MSNEPIRIAQMMTDMNYGGVEMSIMNYYRHIDHSKVQFDFIALENSKIPMKKEIEQLGGRIYIVPKYYHLIDYEKAIQKIFKVNNYKIVHSNMNTLSVLSLYGAKKAGIKIRIAHNHSTAGKGEIKKNIIKYILKPFSKIYPTHLCACTRYAGEWLFGKKADIKILHNAIDVQKFKFDKSIRDKVRKEINLEDKFIIGHVGRLCFQKNQEFLIDLLYEVRKKKDAVLLLIGEGDTKKLKEKAKKLGMLAYIVFLGPEDNINNYYQAMDCFVLPSRYEGLGIVAIEAQAAGLPTICSTAVPREAKITDLVDFLDLNAPISKWAEKVKSVKRKDVSEEIKKAGYDIKMESEKLLQYYERLVE